MSVQNSKCLQPLNGSLQGGVAIVQVTCNDSLAQQWMSAPAPHGMTFTNGVSGMCLDARGKSAAGTQIQQWPCAPGNGISNQFWNYGAKGNELVSEVDPSPNSYCLATPGNDDGNQMALQPCDGNNPQQWNHPLSAGRQTTYGTWLQMSSSDQGPDAKVWTFPNPACPTNDKKPKVQGLCTYIDLDSPVFIFPTTLNLMSVQNGKCLQPLNGSSERGVAIVQVACNNGSLAQQWTSAPADQSSGMSLTNGASGMCLDARGKSAAGTPIQQWPCDKTGNGISNQFWDYGANGNELRSEVRPNPNSYCLATPGNDDGNHMALQPCDGSSPQLWNQTSVPNFTVSNYVTAIDGEATMEVTTCYSDTVLNLNQTGSCKTSEDGGDGQSIGNAYLEFKQLNPDGSTCQVNRAYSEVGGKPVFDEQFSVDKSQHHLPLYWHVSAPVSQLCNGSREFSADLYMQYVNGNPIKIEGDVNINFIDSATAPTTTVPDVIGLTEQQASAAIVAAGLTASPQINLKSPPDTVTAQNAPAGTVEPMGSPVQITVGVRPRNP